MKLLFKGHELWWYYSSCDKVSWISWLSMKTVILGQLCCLFFSVHIIALLNKYLGSMYRSRVGDKCYLAWNIKNKL